MSQYTGAQLMMAGLGLRGPKAEIIEAVKADIISEALESLRTAISDGYDPWEYSAYGRSEKLYMQLLHEMEEEARQEVYNRSSAVTFSKALARNHRKEVLEAVTADHERRGMRQRKLP